MEFAAVEAERRRLEKELEEAEEAGDPLSAWGNHLSWFEENKLTTHQAYREALQRCIEYFASMPHFNTDIRLAKIYIKSASVSKDAMSVYKHMLSENIGTHHALVYESMATALSEQGKTQEAAKILDTGIKNKAQPVKRLQKKLSSLQEQANQVSRPLTSAVETKLVRDKAFYSQPGQLVCYPKALVYPAEGGEIQLEQLRGEMDQYKPTSTDVYKGECDMEMTMAFTGHITEHIPLVPDLFKKGKALIRGSVPSQSGPHSGLNQSPGNGELDELEQLCAEKEPFIKPVVEEDKKSLTQDFTEEDFEQQLEKLVLEKNQPASVMDQPQPTSTVNSHSYLRDKENQLQSSVASHSYMYVIDKENQPHPSAPNISYLRDKENQPHPSAPNISYLRDKENQPQSSLASHSYVMDKENRDQVDGKGTQFGFTPNTVDGGVHWPGRVNSNNSGFPNTKLNFSDISLGGLSHASLAGGEESRLMSMSKTNTSTGRLGVFSTALDIEKRAKLTEEQLMFEKEFATTEVEVLGGEPSLSNSQSFDVYHDSWMGESRNTSRSLHQKSSFARPQHNNSSMQSFEVYHDSWMSQPGNTSRSLHQPAVSAKLKDSRLHQDDISTAVGGGRRVLQELCVQEPLGSTTEDSFSVYEDESQEQSSFVPFHDSWANQPAKSCTTTTTGGNGGEVKVVETVYRAPLGVPIMQGNEEERHKSHDYTMDNSFTQIDIPHPRNFDPSSTPRHHAPLMTTLLDMSAIPGEEFNRQQPSNTQAHNESHVCQKTNLSTIPEESGSYKSSASSSRMTVSSSNSSTASHDSVLENVNPFEPHIVNKMLNSLGVPVGKIETVPGTFPKIVKGRGITIGGDVYTDVNQVAEGGFAKVYLGRYNGEDKILKVECPACEWEVAVLEEIHMRLRTNGHQDKCCSIIQYERALRYKDTSILVLPYFHHGSFLDLVNTVKSLRVPLTEPMLLYYSAEIANVVDTLHQLGIIHADLKPDNFMIRDIRSFSSFQSAKGKGVCLIDFGRAIDTKRFPEDQMFVGSCETEGFQCVAMMEGKPWKWQVDYFGLAGTIFSLMHGGYMVVKKTASDGRYRPTVRVKRRYDIGLWSKVFEVLLNVCGYVPLSQFVQPLEEQLYTKMNSDFRKEVSSGLENVVKYLNAK